MTLAEKLLFIQKALGLTQEHLARQLDVTFAAFNRWINGRALPHPNKLVKIDALFRELIGHKTIPDTDIEAKKILMYKKQREFGNILRKIQTYTPIRDEFDLALTYHSNRIEGSTLTENETYKVLFENRAFKNKSLRGQLEAKNHQTALHVVFDQAVEKKPIAEKDILELHATLMNGVYPDAGGYRRHGVRILGTRVITANYLKIPQLMDALIRTINAKNTDTMNSCARAHAEFERIHPFGDGNGRVGRLLLHLMLLKKNLPPALIVQKNRQKYFLCLQKAQLEENYILLENFLCDAIIASYRLFE